MISGTPSGFRDILPKEALARERISDVVRGCFSAHGYLPVETPLLEDRSALERGGMHQHMQKPPQEVRAAQFPLPGTCVK